MIIIIFQVKLNDIVKSNLQPIRMNAEFELFVEIDILIGNQQLKLVRF